MRPEDDPANCASIISVRAMISSDVPAVLSVLRESPEASMWSEHSLLDSAAYGMAWVAEQEGGVVGFLIGRAVADEFEILNMAVARASPPGIAAQLVGKPWNGRERPERSAPIWRCEHRMKPRLRCISGMVSAQYGRRERYYQYPVEDATCSLVEMNSTEQ